MINRSIELDRAFHALADSSRRTMVERLTQGPASVSQLAAPFAMTLAAVVQHVGVLEDAGLVKSEKVGRVRTCRLDSPALRRAEEWLTVQRSDWEARLDRLADELTRSDIDEES